MRNSQEYTVFSAVTPIAITSSTDASPIVMTVTAHGFSTGDQVAIFGHTTNTNANGIWQVTKVSANTFSLTLNIKSGVISAAQGAGAGGASGIVLAAPKVPLVQDFKAVAMNLDTDNSANMTVKFAGSYTDTCPDFYQPQSPTNQFDFLQVVDLEDGAFIDGDTGIAPAGTDDNRALEINTNGMRWITAVVTAWSAGDVTIAMRLFDNQ